MSVVRYQAYPEYKESGVEWLGLVPAKWSVSKLAFVFTQSNAGEVIDKSNWGDGPEVLYTCNRTPMASDFRGFPEKKRTLENDLLLTRNGTPYVHKPISGAIYSNVVQRISLKDQFDRDYLDYCLGNSATNLKGYGVSIESLNFENWKTLLFSYPALPEQTQIAAFLDHETAKIDRLIEKQQALISLLKEKRQAVISHAVTKGLNPHAPLKDSGIEWLGQVPAHWVVTRAKFASNIFIPQRNKPELNDSNGLPWVTMEDMKGSHVAQTRNFVDTKSAKTAGSKSLAAGSVIASCVGNFGVSSINETDVIINQQLQAFIPFGIKAEFLRETVAISTVYFELVGTAATLVYVNQQGFENLPVLIPPKEEQEDVCNHISLACSKFNELVMQCESTVTLLQERRTALISAAVTGKIDVRQWKPPAPFEAEASAA